MTGVSLPGAMKSNEAKKLGIKMGQPVFECEELIRKHNILVFSSNYPRFARLHEAR